jgi:hypothetical protein
LRGMPEIHWFDSADPQLVELVWALLTSF